MMRPLSTVFPLIAGIFLSLPLTSQAFELGMPIKCHYGKDCFIQNYYDDDNGTDYKDYHCGTLSYNGHDGTDFRIIDYVAMQKGMEVIASAEGVVAATRDSMQDISVKTLGKEAIAKQECGNAVMLQHGEGYRTLYCHMKQGSVVVKKGDRVAKGQKLGEVGLSGLTEFPHVHIGAFKEKVKVDPFIGGDKRPEKCGEPQHPLWDKETAALLRYIPTGLINHYFTSEKPDIEEARHGKFREERVPITARRLVYWADLFGLQKDDTLKLSITAPDGNIIVQNSAVIDHSKALFFKMIGKQNLTLVKGQYRGNVTVIRQGKAVLTETRQVAVY